MRRRAPGAAMALSLLLLTGGDGGARAAAAPVTLEIADCPPARFSAERLRALLRLEIAPRRLVRSGGDVLVLRCSAEDAVVQVGDHVAPLSLRDVPARMVERTLALTLAEALRHQRQAPPPHETAAAAAPAGAEPPAAAPPAAATAPAGAEPPAAAPRQPPPLQPPPPAAAAARASAPATGAASPALAPPPRPRQRALLVATLGLSALTVASFAVGVPLAVVGAGDPSRGDLRGASAYVLGLSVVPLIATSVTFGLWLRERRRAR